MKVSAAVCGATRNVTQHASAVWDRILGLLHRNSGLIHMDRHTDFMKTWSTMDLLRTAKVCVTHSSLNTPVFLFFILSFFLCFYAWFCHRKTHYEGNRHCQ